MRKHSFIISAVIILVVGLFISTLVYTSQKPKTVTYSPTPTFSLDSDALKNQIVQSSKVGFPTTTSETGISSFPSDLQFLINSDGTQTRLEEVTYTNNKKGYKAYFQLMYPFQSAYMSYAKMYKNISGWLGIYAAHGNSFGLFDLQDNTYQAKIIIDAADAGSVNVAVQLMER